MSEHNVKKDFRAGAFLVCALAEVGMASTGIMTAFAGVSLAVNRILEGDLPTAQMAMAGSMASLIAGTALFVMSRPMVRRYVYARKQPIFDF